MLFDTKKLSAFLLVLVTVCSLVACNHSDGGNNGDESGDKGSIPVDQTQTISQTKVTVVSIETVTAGALLFKPADGHVFIFVRVVIENMSSSELTINSLLSFSVTVDGEQTSISFLAVGAKDNIVTLDGEIAPGEKLDGYYPLEVPATAKVLIIEFTPEMWDDESVSFTLDIPRP